MLTTILSIIAVITGLSSLWLSNEQWKKVRAKVGMISDAGKAIEVLPTWYTERMMTDYWTFGLMTESGKTIVIHRIMGISDNGKWMDVELASPENNFAKQIDFITAKTNERTTASIQIDKIILAYELSSS